MKAQKSLRSKPELNFTENDENYRIVSIEDEIFIDSRIHEISEICKTDEVGKFIVTQRNDLSDDDITEMFASSKYILRELDKRKTTMMFNFYLNRDQYTYLNDILRNKLEYDVQTLLTAVELEDMLNRWKNDKTKAKSDIEMQSFQMTAEELGSLYLVVGTNKVKGLTQNAHIFASIIKRLLVISGYVAWVNYEHKQYFENIVEIDRILTEKFNASSNTPTIETQHIGN